MKTYNWDNLKTRIANEQYSLINETRDRLAGCYALLNCVSQNFKVSWRQSQQQLAEAVFQHIRSWDIRMAVSLLDTFPGYTCNRRNKILQIDQNQEGDWELQISNNHENY